ncbi:MAG: GNAT family N-acetyltransferase [SAR202 cluster bacterium]|nr:GNAT family N-acetyltransferase [SAR202 cluster bacterium]
MINQNIRIKELDPHTVGESEATALNIFDNRMRAEQWPLDPLRSVAETIGHWRFVPEYLDLHQWAAWSDAEKKVVGRGHINIGRYEENPHMADFDIDVIPEMRRQGIGKALLRRIVAVARRENRDLLLVTTDRDIPAGRVFLRRLGARMSLASHTNQLDLSHLDMTLVDKWRSRGLRLARSFDLVLREGAYPEGNLEAMAELKGVMNTAPTDALELEAFTWTVDHLRQEDRCLISLGVERWTMFLKDRTTGELAGFTEVLRDRHYPDTVEQGHTAVSLKYRNRGLAQWLKGEMLSRMIKEMPQLKKIRTANADSNAAMLRINRSLGFRPLKSWSTWQVDLDRALGYLGE